MNPQQIVIVAETWHRAGRDAGRLHSALEARLPGTADERCDRATWIVDAVSGLSPVLDRPTTFARSAGHLMRRRGSVTMQDLGVDRSALLGALDDVLDDGPGDLDGVTSDERDRAWDLALRLFEETVAAYCLDPFAAARDRADGRSEGAS